MQRSIRSVVMDTLSLFDSQDLVNIGIGFVVACPLESYKNSKEMRGAVSPLRVTLILTVPHLHLKRAGIRSLSSRTGNTSTYIPASSTLLILLVMLTVFPLYLHYDLCSCFVSHQQQSTLEDKHCNDLQNWHQGIECHSGCNETHTLPTC